MNITISDSAKFKRLIAIAVALVVLLAFEISYFVMNAKVASLPGRTEDIMAQTEKVGEENDELNSVIDEFGDYDQISNNRESWQKIKDQLTE